jgi:uracil phosphoribosyltransferase
MSLTIIDHPLARHVLTLLRDKSTPPSQFRILSHQVTLLLAIEATRELEERALDVDTPMERHTGSELVEPLAVVPILRAGLGMVQPIVDLFPAAAVGYIGLERDHDTAIARSYYCKLPRVDDKHVLLVDPMLATGGSAVRAIDIVMERNPRKLSLLCIVAAPEGVAAVQGRYPALPIFTAGLDRELNARKYILPGLGDFGDRLYGT